MKKQQERAVLQMYLNRLNREGVPQWHVESEPDPPEAIIRAGEKRDWVEVTSAFPSDEYARDAWSAATPGEEHYDTSGKIHVDVDRRLAEAFVRIVEKKTSNPKYKPYREKHGRGILIVDIHSPWFDVTGAKEIERLFNERFKDRDLGHFRELWVTFGSEDGTRIEKWCDA